MPPVFLYVGFKVILGYLIGDRYIIKMDSIYKNKFILDKILVML